MTTTKPLIGLTGRKRSGKNASADIISTDPMRRIAFAWPIKRILIDLNPHLTGNRSSGSFEEAAEQLRLTNSLSAAIPRWTALRDLLPHRTNFDAMVPALLDILDPFTIQPDPLLDTVRLSDLIIAVDDFEVYKDESIPVDLELRRLQQILGTEVGRESIHQELWVKTGIANALRAQKAWPGMTVTLTDCRFDDEALAVREAGGLVVRIVRPGLPEPDDQHASEKGISDDLVDVEIINDGTLQDLERALRNALPIE